jgi:hypothetical protein
MNLALRRRLPAFRRPLLMFLIVAALPACTIKVVSSYDEETDRSVMALQRKIETFLVRLEEVEGASDCGYDHHKPFYTAAKVEVSALYVRTAALSDNDITAEQVALLSKSLGSLEQLHKMKLKKGTGKNCLSKEEIAPLRENFNAGFIAILRLELAKKRGQ